MSEPTQCATPTLLLAPRWPSSSWLMVATVLLGAGTLGLARVDNAPGALGTAGLVIAAWLPAALPLRRTWVMGSWMLWALCLGVFQVAWLVVQDGNGHQTLLGADGSQVSCAYQAGPISFGRVMVMFGTTGLLVGLGALVGAYRRESLAPCHDSTGHLAVAAGAWLSLAGALAVIDAATLDNRFLFCDMPSASHQSKVELTANSSWPKICAPDQKDAQWTTRLCRAVAAPATRSPAIILGALVFGIGSAGAVAAAARIRRRARWLDGWLTRVRSGQIHGWSLGVAVPMSEDDAGSNEEGAPWLARADGEARDGFYQSLSYSSALDMAGDDAGSSYRSNPSSRSGDGVVVARIEKSFDADTIGRVRRGERGARNVVLAVFSPSALAIGLIALYFFIARLAC